ncbi:MAG: amino acid adenylation domain-containing protein [Anaerolineales bacterium]|nr:amino acid adenylation domain-containing protein [Anaerolineales bacterium]
MVRHGVIPASFSQQRLWFVHKLSPETLAYNLERTIEIKGTLDVPILCQSFESLIHRHEALRTTFTMEGGQLVQIISSTIDAPLHISELNEETDLDRLEKARQILIEHSRQMLNLSTGPLLSAQLVRLSEKRTLFQIVMQHIISDGLSLNIIFRDLFEFYQAYTSGSEPQLPPLPLQFADFAVWQRKFLRGGTLENQLSYWKKQLKDPPALLQLPVDRPRPPIQTDNGASLFFELPMDLTKSLIQLGHQDGATPFMVLIAAYNILLSRYTRQTDILVGFPISNRTYKEWENLVGFFANTLILRTDLSGNPTFRNVLQRVKHAALDAYANQDMPFELLVQELNPERDLSISPIFQVTLSFQNVDNYEVHVGDLTINRHDLDIGTTPFDWTLYIQLDNSRLRGRFRYNTDLFNRRTIQQAIYHFQRLLEGILLDPSCPISQLPLLSPQERNTLLVEWNKTRTDYPRYASVHQLFESQAEQRPDATAVISGSEQWSYQQLNEKANRVAYLLQSYGIAPGEPVAIYLERSAEMVVCMLGILKAGGAYVPLDLNNPAERLALMLRDVQARVLLTRSELEKCIPLSGDLNIVPIDTDVLSGDLDSRENPENRAAPDDPAYIMYTSGTTGLPKGIIIPHRAINRLVCNTNYIKIGPADRVAHLSNVSFDAATFEIWGPLLNGATMVVVPQDVLLSPADFSSFLREQSIHSIFLTTALFNRLAALQPGLFSGVRDVLFGGEMVTPYYVRKVLQDGPPQRLLHVYGPTESTTFATWHLINDVPDEAVNVPIGKPIANTRLYLLDDELQPVPIGVIGEIYIAGEGLALGYWNQAELTASHFLQDPYGDPGRKMYKTGDLARYLEDGSIEFCGRSDDQVKIRGYRIELNEIEFHISAHPLVEHCIVIARERSVGGKESERYLAAYIVCTEEQANIEMLLREFLKPRLPAYMIPAVFCILKTLPLNENGKVDRSALPEPFSDAGQNIGGALSPRDAVESQLVALWEEVLNIHPIGLEDNFFDLGGHSLLAIELFARINEIFGRQLPLAALFRSPSVIQLANELRIDPAIARFSLLVPIQTVDASMESGPPIFLIHTIRADLIEYAQLVRSFGPDQSFYGLLPRGLDGREPPLSTIPEMAAAYIDAIRLVQPHGPYNLVGYCFAGVVAYEMACQLHARGEAVDFLVIIDGFPPRHAIPFGAHFFAKILTFVRNLPTWMKNINMLSLMDRWKGIVKEGIIQVKMLAGRLGIPIKILPEEVLNVRSIELFAPDVRKTIDAMLLSLVNYRPGHYPGHLTLIRGAALSMFRGLDPQSGWEFLVDGGIALHVIPSKHENLLLPPSVKIVADLLRKGLKRV